MSRISVSSGAHRAEIMADAFRRPFDPATALDLIRDIEEDIQSIRVQAVFANDGELETIMHVYREGVRVLQDQISQNSR